LEFLPLPRAGTYYQRLKHPQTKSLKSAERVKQFIHDDAGIRSRSRN
jgi:hypothetical protein